MSTASAVLRRYEVSVAPKEYGTYVYRFGGIETFQPPLSRLQPFGTYVYRFGGIETNYQKYPS